MTRRHYWEPWALTKAQRMEQIQEEWSSFGALKLVTDMDAAAAQLDTLRARFTELRQKDGDQTGALRALYKEVCILCEHAEDWRPHPNGRSHTLVKLPGADALAAEITRELTDGEWPPGAEGQGG